MKKRTIIATLKKLWVIGSLLKKKEKKVGRWLKELKSCFFFFFVRYFRNRIFKRNQKALNFSNLNRAYSNSSFIVLIKKL